MSGYLLGILVCTVAAVLIAVGAYVYLFAVAVRTVGSPGATPYIVLSLGFGGYLLIAAVLAAFTSWAYGARPGVAFLLNVAPLPAIIALHFLRMYLTEYAERLDIARAYRRASDDAPAIRLGALYVKKAEGPLGGVILFMHVPFTVDREVWARSLNILVTSNDLARDVRYSPKPICNSGYRAPPYGFFVVDREYTEPHRPGPEPKMKLLSGLLRPGTQYYLLRELHFTNSRCTVSDYEGFDPCQLKVTLDIPANRQSLNRA